MRDHSKTAGRALGLLSAAGLTTAWREERRRASTAQAEATRARAEAERVEKQLRRRELELARERQLLTRLQQSRRAEREWNRELRSQLQRLHQRPQIHAGSGDVRALVLEAACRLLEAEKGLLVAFADADGDGLLDLPVSRGFHNDPSDSALAQRFAREVLKRDETVRETAPAQRAGLAHALTDADREIEELVAIPLFLRDRFHGVVVCANRPGGFADVDDDLLLALGDHAGAALHTSHLRMDLAEAHQGAVTMLLEALTARDAQAHRESAATAALAGSFAEALELSDEDRETLVLATLLRDLGFLTAPEHLLQRPGPLSADERAVLELHPRVGFMILRRLPVLRDVAYAVLYHHERHDGSGYPYGLARDDVPLVARAVAVVDAFAALTHDRPYRPGRPVADACEELVQCADSQFDPEVTARFVEHVRRRPPEAQKAVEAVFDGMTLLSSEEPSLFGALTAPDLDPLTLLGGHRAFRDHLDEALADVAPEDAVVLVMLQIEALARLNEQGGPLAGDRLIQAVARLGERAAARAAGSAFRVSGRRLALVVKAAPERVPDIVRDLELEFATGPSVRLSVAVGRSGDRAEDLIAAARSPLRAATR